MKTNLTVWLVCLLFVGCGGGGGSGGDSTTSGGGPTEAERTQAFVDEAIRLSIQDAIVTCQTVMCPIADSDFEDHRPDGVVVHGCHWECMESVIDDSGEARNYFIIIRWERLPDGCFGAAEVLQAQETPVLCVPNQDRF